MDGRSRLGPVRDGAGRVVRAGGRRHGDARPLDAGARAAPARTPRRAILRSDDRPPAPSRDGRSRRLPARAVIGRRTPMERILGDVATRLLHENERVRIWEMDLASGARSATHRHDLDYVLVQIEGDRIAAEPEPDTGGAYRDYIEADVVPGRVRYIRRGGMDNGCIGG